MGGGKSFSATQRMLRQIASGGVVYSNIQLKIDPWHNPDYDMKEFHIPVCPLLERVGYIPECKLSPAVGVSKRLPLIETDNKGRRCWVFNSHGADFFLRRFCSWNYQEGQFNYLPDDVVGPSLSHHLPRGAVDYPVLVVLDEALDHFESESANTNAEFRSFLRHVRKLGINLIFIAQDFGSLEKKIRVLTHYVWTFRDMKTWKVPVIGAVLPNGVLPYPWNDVIQQRQYHGKQFGTIKAEPINKGIFQPRDTFVFQCYQSVSLHNAAIQMNGVASHFGEGGRISKGKKKMNKFERILIYGLLGVALSFGFKKAPVPPSVPVVSAASVASPSAVTSPVVSKVEKAPDIPNDGFDRNESGEIVERLPISWCGDGKRGWYYVEGNQVFVGASTSRGEVLSVDTKVVKFRDYNGSIRWIFHQSVGFKVARSNGQSS